MSAIDRVVELLGGYEATGRACGVSGKAVMKWAKKGRLPRTEWTGETNYASLILEALERTDNAGAVSLTDLRPPAFDTEAA